MSVALGGEDLPRLRAMPAAQLVATLRQEWLAAQHMGSSDRGKMFGYV
ncbi:hypothetical protein [Pseudomonas sp. 2FE]|nr:hypothetical protein [Pseudomonas sp. 2FE]